MPGRRARLKRTFRRLTLSGLLLWWVGLTAAWPQSGGEEDVSVLVVVAHPDDEAMFAAAVYKITHILNGSADLAVVTDGSGGYRYSHLAEPIYGLDLTDEKVARKHLPAIRKQELKAAGDIIGIRDYFFLDEFDHQYTEDPDTVLRYVWNADAVRNRLREIMRHGDYDYVFVHLPIPSFHGHHKAATILALEAARDLEAPEKPVVLGSFVGNKSDTLPMSFSELPGYPITEVSEAPFVFDRTEPLSEDGRLNYQIIVNWNIAEHKSQGTMQLLINRGDLERFWFFDVNDPSELPATRAFFERLSVPAYVVDGR